MTSKTCQEALSAIMDVVVPAAGSQQMGNLYMWAAMYSKEECIQEMQAYLFGGTESQQYTAAEILRYLGLHVDYDRSLTPNRWVVEEWQDTES